MPMSNKINEMIGVFQVLNKKGGAFTEEDEDLLAAVSVIAASAIENAQLYDDQNKSFVSFVETPCRFRPAVSARRVVRVVLGRVGRVGRVVLCRVVLR